MNKQPLDRLLVALAENEAFRAEVVELAMRHGIDFSEGEIPDAELDAVSGGTLSYNLAAMEKTLASLGGDGQLANIDMQNALQTQQQTLQTMSNVSKMMHDTAMSIIRKIG